MKILPVAAELYHQNGGTDGRKERRDEIESCFSQ